MTQSIYDNPVFFGHYSKLRQNPQSLNELVEKPTMFSLLPDLRGKRILDLGCGAGEHLAYYAQSGASLVVGLDLSEKMLEQAKQAVEKVVENQQNPTACRFYHLSMTALSQIAECDFDVITSSFAFHYIDDLPALLTQIHRKLAPQGLLIFSQEHPITTAYRTGERWEKDETGRQVAYRLNYYREEGERERNWFQQAFKTYHRTFATLVNDLITQRFSIQQVVEPMLQNQPEWHETFKDLRHRPPLLFIKSVRI